MRALLDTLLLGRDPGPPPRWVRVAAVIAAVALAAISGASRDQAIGVMSWLLGILAAAPLALAAWSSLWAWRLAWLVAMLVGVLGLPREAGWPWHPVQLIVLLLVLFVVGLRQRLGVVLWVGLFTLVPIWLYVLPNNRAGATVLYVVPLAMGWLLQGRLAAQRRLAAEQERGAVLTERARIARELHDVVAHHMSLIAVRAETAGYRLTGVEEPARREFAEIAGAAREALTEMRRLLGVLRDGDALTTPQPGLAELPELLEAARAAGTEVSCQLDGELTGLPPAVDVSAYRIIQEAVSNAARHAPGTPVSVAVRRDGDAVRLTVENPAGATPATAGEPGHGLRGMRERVSMLDGELSAGPRDDGGFTVRASLPIGGTP